jgi:hypothetical protein
MTPYNERRLFLRIRDILAWRCFEMTGWSPNEWRLDVAPPAELTRYEEIIDQFRGQATPELVNEGRRILYYWDERYCRTISVRLGRKVRRIRTLR